MTRNQKYFTNVLTVMVQDYYKTKKINMEAIKQKQAKKVIEKILAHLMMEVDEVYNGSTHAKRVREIQITALIYSICAISNIPVTDLVSGFKQCLKDSVKEYEQYIRVADGEEILNQLLNEEES